MLKKVRCSENSKITDVNLFNLKKKKSQFSFLLPDATTVFPIPFQFLNISHFGIPAKY